MSITVHHLSPGVAWLHSGPDWLLVTARTGCLHASDLEDASRAAQALDLPFDYDPALPSFLEDYDFSLHPKKVEFQYFDAPAIVHCNLYIHEDAPEDAETLLPVLLLPLLAERLRDDDRPVAFRVALHPMRMNLYEEAEGGRWLSGDAWFARFLPPALVPRTAVADDISPA